jgi:hypothetical protein
MLNQTSSRDAHAWIVVSLKQRPDIGLRKAVVNFVFEPPNPFDATARRRPRLWFGLLVFGLAAFTLAFVCFEIVPWIHRP